MIVVLQNVYARVAHASPEEVAWLRQYLTYTPRESGRGGFFSGDKTVLHSRGREHLFPAGLLDLVRDGAARPSPNEGREPFAVDVQDARVRPCEPDADADIEWLVDHQRAGVRAVVEKTRGILAHSTSAGKGEVAVALTRVLPCAWLMCAHRFNLCQDIAQRYEARAGKRAGLIGDGEWTLGDGQLVCATWQTLYQKLEARDPRAQHLVRQAQGLIAEECHVVAAETFRAVCTAAVNAYWRCGLSVGPDSIVCVRRRQETRITTIAEFARDVAGMPGPGQVDVAEWEVRCFADGAFSWAPIEKVIAHAPEEKRCFEIKVATGRRLLVTEDHSVYRVARGKRLGDRSSGKRGCPPKNNSKSKFHPMLECVEGGAVAAGDYLLLAQVAEPFGIAQRFDVEARLPREKYVRDDRGYLAGRQGRRHWCAPTVDVAEFGYVLGYFLGNGWIDRNRVNFAVRKERLDAFLRETCGIFSTFGATPKIRAMPRGSVEVRVGSKALVDVLTALGCDQYAHEKRVPNVAYSWPRRAIEAVVRGMNDTDGHLAVDEERATRRWHYTTTSRLLAAGLCELLRRLDVPASTSTDRAAGRPGGVIAGKQVVGRHDRYVVHWSDYAKDGRRGSGRWPECFVKGGLPGLPVLVREVRDVAPPALVYDFQVGGCANFVADDLLVHNSGTPLSRTDRRSIYAVGMIGPIIHKVAPQELVDIGFAAKLTVHVERVTQSRAWTDDKYQTYVVDSAARNARVLAAVMRHERPSMVFVRRLDHADALRRMVERAGLKAFVLVGRVPPRRRADVMRACTREGDAVLITNSVTQEGEVDKSIVEFRSMVNAGGLSSAIVVNQQAGRLMRRFDKAGREVKAEAHVVDFMDEVDGDPDASVTQHARDRVKAYMKAGHDVRLEG